MRFSLRNLLIGMSLVSLYLGVAVGLPSIVSAPILLLGTLCVPSVAAAGIVYGRGWHRAFWIGCVGPGFAASVVAFYLAMVLSFEFFDGDIEDEALSSIKGTAVAFHVTCIISGLSAVGLRWGYSTPRREHGSESSMSS